MQVQVVRIPAWSRTPWLVHAFSTRVGGKTRVYRPQANQRDLNLGFTDSDDHRIVAGNRGLFLQEATRGKDVLGLVTLRQIHSAVIHRVGAQDVRPNDQPAVLQGDGLMTDESGVLLGIQTADCIPVLVADLKTRAVAAFHAGWRGTVARIVENGVERMRLEFGSSPEDMVASLGPGIGQCCYSVGDEVREQFASQFVYAAELLGPATHLDLAEANRRQLLAAGIKESAIAMTGQCTGCHPDLFFSHRMERGFTGRLMSVIGVASV